MIRDHVGPDPDATRKVEGCDYLKLPRGLILSMLEGMKLRIYYRAIFENFQTEKLKKRYGAGYHRLVETATTYAYSAAGVTTVKNAFAAIADRKTLPKDADAFLATLKTTLIAMRPKKYEAEIRNYVDGPRGMEAKYREITKVLGGGECF